MPNEVKTTTNSLPALPSWGVHRSAITAADTSDPTDAMVGVNTEGWESIWVDIHFKAVGTKTATIKPLLWCPGTTADGSSYSGAFFVQDAIADIPVFAGDAGHKTIELQTKGRIVFFKFTALGSGAEAHVLVAGSVRAR